MSTLGHSSELLNVEEYLEGESRAETKHEYLGGVVYAMAGASEAHNVIAANLMGMLHAQLRGKACQPFGPDMKVRLETLGGAYNGVMPKAHVISLQMAAVWGKPVAEPSMKNLR